jgi:hypothetical protein
MDRRSTWIVAGAILLGTTLLGVSLAVAQRDFRTETRWADTGPVRYQVVNVTDGEIIIMDVTTGDLYSAKPRDVKPYDARPRAGQQRDRPRIEFKDKGDFKDEYPKRKAPLPDARKDLPDTRKDL